MKSFLSLFKKKSSSSDASSSDKDAPYSPSIGFVPATPPFAYRKHKTHVVKKPRPYRLNRYAKALITSGGNPAAMAKALVGQGDPPKDLPDFKVLFPANSAVIDLCNNNNTTTPGCMASFDVIQKDKWVPQKYMVTCGKVPERRKPVRWLKEGLNVTYKRCNPKYAFKPGFTIPKRVLTTPTIPRHNGGADNENYDLIMHVGDVLGSAVAGSQAKFCWLRGSRYTVLDVLGRGTFGQVVKCRDEEHGRLVAVKVLKNKPAYFRQGLMEIGVLTAVNSNIDIDGSRHTLRLLDHFLYQNHLCIVNELLSMSLYDVVKSCGFRGVTVRLARAFLRQLLDALSAVEAHGIVHCDLKPENVLLNKPGTSAITLIDFGSACFEDSTLYTYIQSRHYRAPEVILGLQYTCAIDMWSLGCIAAELFLGIPIFPGASEYNQLYKITQMLGMPPAEMVDKGTNAGKFFKPDEHKPSHYVLKTPAEFERDTNFRVDPDKRYMSYTSLDDFAAKVPLKTGYAPNDASPAANPAEIRRSLLSFLSGLLEIDPTKRLTPDQALAHPFLTEVPLPPDYAPPAPRRPQPRHVRPAQPSPLKLPPGTPSKVAGMCAAEVYNVFLTAIHERKQLVDTATGIVICSFEDPVVPSTTPCPPPPVPPPEYSAIQRGRTSVDRLSPLATSSSSEASSYASLVTRPKKWGKGEAPGKHSALRDAMASPTASSAEDEGYYSANRGSDAEEWRKKQQKSQLRKTKKISILELENENGMLSLASPMMSVSMARTAKKEAKEAKLAAEEARSKKKRGPMTECRPSAVAIQQEPIEAVPEFSLNGGSNSHNDDESNSTKTKARAKKKEKSEKKLEEKKADKKKSDDEDEEKERGKEEEEEEDNIKAGIEEENDDDVVDEEGNEEDEEDDTGDNNDDIGGGGGNGGGGCEDGKKQKKKKKKSSSIRKKKSKAGVDVVDNNNEDDEDSSGDSRSNKGEIKICIRARDNSNSNSSDSDNSDDINDHDDGNTSGTVSYAEEIMKKYEKRKKKKKLHKLSAGIEVPPPPQSLEMAALSASPQTSHIQHSSNKGIKSLGNLNNDDSGADSDADEERNKRRVSIDVAADDPESLKVRCSRHSLDVAPSSYAKHQTSPTQQQQQQQQHDNSLKVPVINKLPGEPCHHHHHHNHGENCDSTQPPRELSTENDGNASQSLPYI